MDKISTLGTASTCLLEDGSRYLVSSEKVFCNYQQSSKTVLSELNRFSFVNLVNLWGGPLAGTPKSPDGIGLTRKVCRSCFSLSTDKGQSRKRLHTSYFCCTKWIRS